MCVCVRTPFCICVYVCVCVCVWIYVYMTIFWEISFLSVLDTYLPQTTPNATIKIIDWQFRQPFPTVNIGEIKYSSATLPFILALCLSVSKYVCMYVASELFIYLEVKMGISSSIFVHIAVLLLLIWCSLFKLILKNLN